MPKKTAALEKLGVTWKAAQRKRVMGSVDPLPGDPKPMTKDEAWTALHERYAKAKFFDLGDHETLPEHEEALAELRAELRRKVAPAPKADPLRELLRFQLVSTEAELPKEQWSTRHRAVLEACLALWTETLGLPFAAEMLVRAHKLAFGGVARGDQRRLTTHATKEAFRLGDSSVHYWLLLRRQVLSAPREAHDAAKERCEHVLRGSLASKKPILLNAFCRDPRELHDLVARTVKSVPVGGGSFPALDFADLLSGIFDADLAMRIADGLPRNYAAGAPVHAFDLVDNIGKAAAPALVEMLRRISSGDRQPLADAAALADLDVARAAVKKLDGPAKTALGKAVW